MSNEVRLKNFLNDNGIKVQSVKYSDVFGVDCYLIYTCKNYNINYLRKQLGNIKIYRVPRLQGERGSVLIINAEDGHGLLKGCKFNFLDALDESDREELIKRQLIINDCGNKDTRVRFKKGSMVLLYNTEWSSSCIANALNICDDSVIDVSAHGCGDLKMIVLLDRVDKYTYKPKSNIYKPGPMPSVKFCENDFDLEKNALNMPNPLNCIRKQLAKNCISCGGIDISSDDLIRIGTAAKTDDIAAALNIPAKSVVDLVDKKYILLDRVLRKVKSK